MKKTLLLVSLITTLNSFAFDVNLANSGSMLVGTLTEIGATTVSCEETYPRCILADRKFGIQYRGQDLSDVEYTKFYGAEANEKAFQALKERKEAGFCM